MQYSLYLPQVALITCPLPGSYGFTVRSALIIGSRHRVVIDTLMQPADVAPFGPASLVIYTHSDWDHCWGTPAFPAAPVVGHAVARERLLSPEASGHLTQMQGQYPDRFAGSAIVAPDIIFDHHLRIDAGGLTFELHHIPGHTADSVVVHVPELDLLVAGDVAEDPLPSLNETGHIRAWADSLRRWVGSGVRHVVPGHGSPGGPELLDRNAAYLEELIGRCDLHLSEGRDLDEIQGTLKIDGFLPGANRYPPYYRETHLQNIARVVAELQAP